MLDWSGVIVGVLFFLTKACGGGLRLLVAPAAKPPGPADGGNALAITVSLFAAILVPAMLANGAVELVPWLRGGAIAPAAMIVSILLAAVLTVKGACVGCRGAGGCCRGG